MLQAPAAGSFCRTIRAVFGSVLRKFAAVGGRSVCDHSNRRIAAEAAPTNAQHYVTWTHFDTQVEIFVTKSCKSLRDCSRQFRRYAVILTALGNCAYSPQQLTRA